MAAIVAYGQAIDWDQSVVRRAPDPVCQSLAEAPVRKGIGPDPHWAGNVPAVRNVVPCFVELQPDAMDRGGHSADRARGLADSPVPEPSPYQGTTARGLRLGWFARPHRFIGWTGEKVPSRLIDLEVGG